MNKKEILLFGAILESDSRWEDGYGSTEEDTEMLQKALKKVCGINDYALNEELQNAELQMDNDLKELLIEYRDKVNKFMEGE